MRLLDTRADSSLPALRTFSNPSRIPKYAILSHTWLEDGEEILFEHVQSGNYPERCSNGYEKIKGCCEQAFRDGYEHVWIDTCCIDKTSSAELSEAINSMYQIYEQASKCYVHLADVYTTDTPAASDSAFRNSRWFSRGWTLQELIAPWRVEFFTSDWRCMGNKHSLARIVEEITGIDSRVLQGTRRVSAVSIAKRMSYAADRETTRPEDRAYSLMGLFGINMPTIYGEGGERAFIRLQYEIMAISPAYGLLTWSPLADAKSDVLAPSPSYFSRSYDIVDIPYDHFTRAWGLDDETAGFQRGLYSLRTKLPIFDVPGSDEIHAIMVIPCKIIKHTHKRTHTMGLALVRTGIQSDQYCRTWHDVFVNVDSLGNMDIPWSHRSITLIDQGSKSDPRQPGHAGIYTRSGQIELGRIVVKCRSENVAFVSTPSRLDGYGPWRQLETCFGHADPIYGYETEVSKFDHFVRGIKLTKLIRMGRSSLTS